jgi:ribokinase
MESHSVSPVGSRPASQVVGIGLAVIDYLGIVPKMPQFDEVEAVRVLQWTVTNGGPAGTALAALAHLGVPVGYIGRAGDDLAGQMIRQNLITAGINVDCLKHSSALRSTTTFVSVEAGTGRRAFLSFRDDYPDDPLSPQELDAIRGARYLHLDTNHAKLALQAAREARSSGVQVSLDAYKVATDTPEWVSLTDVLIANESFPQKYTGHTDLVTASSALLSQGPWLVVTTLSERGCLVVTAEEQFYAPGFKVDVVDTTGAGDVFHGAFLYGLLLGWDLARAARFANAAGAMKCRQFAGWAGIPTLEQVESFLSLNSPGNQQ